MELVNPSESSCATPTSGNSDVMCCVCSVRHDSPSADRHDFLAARTHSFRRILDSFQYHFETTRIRPPPTPPSRNAKVRRRVNMELPHHRLQLKINDRPCVFPGKLSMM